VPEHSQNVLGEFIFSVQICMTNTECYSSLLYLNNVSAFKYFWVLLCWCIFGNIYYSIWQL